MNNAQKRFRCPLCGSLLTQTRYYEIIGLWEERKRLEKTLKEQLNNLKREKQKLLLEKKTI
jgi:transcription initiation factor IIE alpha subunit